MPFRPVRRRPAGGGADGKAALPAGGETRDGLAACPAMSPAMNTDMGTDRSGDASVAAGLDASAEAGGSGGTGREPVASRAARGEAAARDDCAVELRGLAMRFGAVEALRGLDARIPAGRITGLVGPDGAGKTTLLRLLAGLMEPARGQALLFGRPARKVAAAAPNSIGYMPQRFGLYEDLSVMANLQLHARLRGLEGQAREALFERLLAFTSLGPFTGRLAGRLSGGMKQKLGIACALLGAPRVLLLDEPGVGVDPLSRQELWRMVSELSDDGMTVIWSTAYLDEAARCPGIIMLDGGRILYDGPPRGLTARVEGRVFHVPPGGEGSKAALARWTRAPGVEDALMQGSRIRVLLARDAPPVTAEAVRAAGGEPVAARLEDAYMHMVGGLNQEPSPYGRPGRSGGQAARPATEAPERIVARELTKRFGSFTAADRISFSVRAGEIFGLLGPNGAGKSTTFRMLCGLSRPTSGRCSVDGVDLLRAGSAARSRLGYMAQKFSLYLDIPVRENIRTCADLYGLDPERREALLPVLARALELTDYLDSRTSSLPLGQKQRLALLCATLHEPPVLFLDEPTSGVDARTRRDFWKHITAMTEAGASVLVTTHFMEEAEYCDRMALIYRGAMISMGTPDELKASCRGMAGVPDDPTLEDAFIASIRRYDAEHPQ